MYLNHMKPHKIIKIQKPGWRIYYDCAVRYPICVVETFYGRLPSANIKRIDVGEPFRADVAVPKNFRMYWSEYEDYMSHGGSPGHNAPAGFHKKDLTDYRRTFLLSNICPQEMVFNSGVWLVLENHVRDIVHAFPKVDILTGSVPGKDATFGKSTINVPSHMYKVVVATDRYGKTYSVAYMMPNNAGTCDIRIDKFVVSSSVLERVLMDSAGFDVVRIVGSVGGTGAKPLKLVHPIRPKITSELKALVRSSRMNGDIVYSKTIAELDANYGKIETPSTYNKIYYERAKARILSKQKGFYLL